MASLIDVAYWLATMLGRGWGPPPRWLDEISSAGGRGQRTRCVATVVRSGGDSEKSVDGTEAPTCRMEADCWNSDVGNEAADGWS
jgi:hypothetical protein